MILNTDNLAALRIGYSAAFQRGFGLVAPLWDRVATRVPSASRDNKYAWLGQMPGLREWVGPRAVQNLAASDYTVRNRTYELTVAVPREDILDDTYGVYEPMMAEMGRAVAAHPDSLVFGALRDGFSTPCYDGQFFFDADHPVLDANGAVTTVANTDGGSGARWFLLCTRLVLKPLIFQVREEAQFVSRDRVSDQNVFEERQFVYGVHARYAVGYGFWQTAWGSRQTLDDTNYAAARAAVMGFRGDGGAPLGLVPDLLVVPPALEGAARRLLNSDYATGGATNPWRGTADLLVVPQLA